MLRHQGIANHNPILDALPGRHVEAGRVHADLVRFLDHTAAGRTGEMHVPTCLDGRNILREVQQIKARDEISLTLRTRPAPMMPRPLLPQPPDWAFVDILGGRIGPERQTAVLVVLGPDHAPPRRRRHGTAKIRIGVAAPLDQAKRIALSLHVGQHLVVFVDQRQRRRDPI